MLFFAPPKENSGKGLKKINKDLHKYFDEQFDEVDRNDQVKGLVVLILFFDNNGMKRDFQTSSKRIFVEKFRIKKSFNFIKKVGF